MYKGVLNNWVLLDCVCSFKDISNRIKTYQKVSEHWFPQMLMCFEEPIFQAKVTLISAKCEYSSIQVHECKTVDESVSTVC